MKTKLPPRGVWAIGSDLAGVAGMKWWAETASPAQAMSLRRPCGSIRRWMQGCEQVRKQTPFLALHGYADFALAVGADAIIAGVRTLPLPIYRRAFPQLMLGASTHSSEELQRAKAEGADFAFFGPVWNTPEKEGVLTPRGLDQLAAACRLGLPIYALGGIQTVEQALACIKAGAHGVAVLRLAQQAKALQEMVLALSEVANAPDAPEGC